ncbi:MAG: PAS domain-containing methyl-accepting chemotaxis protein [Alphaproteobacteria bacterium]|jgi:methyl-accepting chemotaxis protein|nr:PAS domain-containing methyl-accepting chemotaxis protein [Alphaproteobacteria bacterium]MBP9876862.1 PAS domain-containing methyl-accepting chemotaxis protein [Alphaproteobacteria bacterium]
MFFQNSQYKNELDSIQKSQAVIYFEPNGTIISANQHFLSVMGYSLDEIKGKHHSMFVDPQYTSSPEYYDFWQKLSRGEHQVAQFKRYGKGGKEVWIEASYNPITNSHGKVIKIVKYATDITKQKLENADHLGQIEAIGKSQAVIHFDTNGIILTANDNFLSTMGYTLDEIKGKHHSLFAEPAYAESDTYKEFWDTLRAGQFQTGQFRRLGKGGKEVWIEASYNPILDMDGKPFKIVKYATDITKQKFQDADYSGQINAADKSQAVIHFHLDGTIIKANKNFLDAMGYTLEDIQGKHHRIFTEPAYAQSDAYKEFWAKLNAGEYQSGEYKRIGKNGREVWIIASYNPILDMNGRPFKVVKFATDITGQMSARIDSRNLTSQMHETIQAVAGAAEEMTASVAEISSNMSTSNNAVTDIAHKIQETNDIMLSLQNTTKSMETVVDMIRNIAGQVNLLALNATIEASRAGDAGKGFAVVASEVKNLANEVSKATDDIAGKISILQDMSTQAAESAASVNQATGAVKQSVGAVASAIEEQSAVTREIASNMQQASNGVDNLNKCIQKLSSAA